MNNLHEKAPPAPGSLSAPATRPFTRTLNVFYDAIKPKLYYKVDRSVLDALVRQLEGYHQPSVALMIPELAEAAGVSPWSTTKALARLEKSGVIVRWRKKMRKSGRYIWELALPESFRVIQGVGPVVPETSPSPEPARPAPRARSLPKLEREIPAAPQQLTLPVEAKPERASVPPSPRREPQPSPALSPRPPSPPVAEQPPKKKKRTPLTAEQLQSLQRLREVNIDYWMAKKLARKHSPELIDQVVRHLRGRVGTVRNPAAWIVRELERGGYAAPPTEQEEIRKQERAAREAEKKQVEAHQRELAEQATQRLVQTFLELAPEHQAQLEHQVRGELRRVSPRLAEAPLDLDSAGPLRSKLLELLEISLSAKSPPPEARSGPKPASFTPRRGGFRRGPARDALDVADSS